MIQAWLSQEKRRHAHQKSPGQGFVSCPCLFSAAGITPFESSSCPPPSFFAPLFLRTFSPAIGLWRRVHHLLHAGVQVPGVNENLSVGCFDEPKPAQCEKFKGMDRVCQRGWGCLLGKEESRVVEGGCCWAGGGWGFQTPFPG